MNERNRQIIELKRIAKVRETNPWMNAGLLHYSFSFPSPEKLFQAIHAQITEAGEVARGVILFFLIGVFFPFSLKL